MSRGQIDFKVAAKAYVDALAKTNEARREFDRLARAYENAQKVSAEAKKELGKFVGPNIKTRATALSEGQIVMVEHAEGEPICRVWDENAEEART